MVYFFPNKSNILVVYIASTIYLLSNHYCPDNYLLGFLITLEIWQKEYESDADMCNM